MAELYAVSDIHGHLHSLEDALALVDLDSNKENQLVFCGDYMDYGPDSCRVLYHIKQLADEYPQQIIVLMGNHEYMFLEFLYAQDRDIWNIEWVGTDRDYSTIHSFISQSCKEEISSLTVRKGHQADLLPISKIIKNDILTNHAPLVKWLKELRLYYETEAQIFVHAGIDEEAEEYWKIGTSHDIFISKYPATFGKFQKDIIAGHISTSSLTGQKDFHHVYWDGESHLFIDGETNKSGIVPVLKYDTIASRYTSFRKVLDCEGSLKWEEYLIK